MCCDYNISATDTFVNRNIEKNFYRVILFIEEPVGKGEVMLQKGDNVGIVCCSNGQKQANQNKIEQLNEVLLSIGIRPVLSPFIYEKEDVAAGTAKERAGSLMDFYKDDKIKAIFDISGGDIANEILPYLDFDVIAGAGKVFWGYSDLTTVINAIYAKTQKASVLYQVRNMIYREL